MSALGFPGLTNLAQKTFALAPAASRKFEIAFTEFQGSAKAITFRVTGLTPLLTPLFAACPSDALMAVGDDNKTRPEELLEKQRHAWTVLRAKAPTPSTPERQLRQEIGPQPSEAPHLGSDLTEVVVEIQAVVRRP